MKTEWIVVLIITFIVVLAWVGLEIYRAQPSPPVNPKVESQIQPLDASLDQQTLQQIKTQVLLPNTGPIVLPTPTPSATPVPTATPLPNFPQLTPNIPATSSAQPTPGGSL